MQTETVEALSAKNAVLETAVKDQSAEISDLKAQLESYRNAPETAKTATPQLPTIPSESVIIAGKKVFFAVATFRIAGGEKEIAATIIKDEKRVVELYKEYPSLFVVKD